MANGASPSIPSQTTYPPMPAFPIRLGPDLRGPQLTLPTPQEHQSRPPLVYSDQCGPYYDPIVSLIHL